MQGASTPFQAPSPVSPNHVASHKGHLAEVWGDVVDRRHLAAAVVIGAVVSLGTFLIAARIFAATVAVPDVGRAYAMLVGLLGCVLSGLICAKLFPPKREVVETAADPAWQIAAMQQLAGDTGTIGRLEDLPPQVIAEMKELGLYELFAAHDAGTLAPATTGKEA